MKHLIRIKEQQELIKDLSAIIVACNTAIEPCTNPNDYETLKRDLIISYEERERQYKILNQMLVKRLS